MVLAAPKSMLQKGSQKHWEVGPVLPTIGYDTSSRKFFLANLESKMKSDDMFGTQLKNLKNSNTSKIVAWFFGLRFLQIWIKQKKTSGFSSR